MRAAVKGMIVLAATALCVLFYTSKAHAYGILPPDFSGPIPGVGWVDPNGQYEGPTDQGGIATWGYAYSSYYNYQETQHYSSNYWWATWAPGGSMVGWSSFEDMLWAKFDSTPVDTNNPARQDWTTEPINPVNGAVVEESTDIAIPAPGIDLVFGRIYNSAFSNTNGPLGGKRTHSFNWRVTGSHPMFTVHTGDGSAYNCSYVPNMVGVYRCSLENAWELRQAANGTFTLAMELGKSLLFATNGLLTAIQDLVGNEVGLSYSNHPLGVVLARTEHNNGQFLTFAYDTNAQLTSVQTPSTNWYLTLDYDTAGQLTNVVRHGATWQEPVSYEHASGMTGRLTSVHRTDAAIAHYSYDTNTGFAVGMVMDSTGYAHIVSSFPTSGTATVIYQRGCTNLPYVYEFDPSKMLVTKRSGPDATNNPVEHRQYDPHFLDVTNLISDDTVTGEHLERWSQFDTRHNLTNMAIGYNATPSNYWTFAWHTNLALPTASVDPDNIRQAFTYTNGLLTSAGVSLGVSTATTVCAWSTNGLLLAVTNADGQWMQYAYDGYGFATSAIPATGPAVTCENDQFGHLLSVSMPGDVTTRVTRFTSDERGLVHDITYPDGLQESFSYDVAGRLTNAVDRLGRATTCTWLPTRKLASVTRGGATLQYQYDNQFNSLAILDPLGRAVERYTLDARDRPVQVVNVASQQMTVAYGLENLVRGVTRFDGSTISNRYDGDMRLVEQDYPGLTNRFAWTPAGRLRSAAGCQSQTYSLTNFYDAGGRLTGTVANLAGIAASVSWRLSPAGIATNAVSPGQTVARTFDLAGRIETLTTSTGTWAWTYNTNNGLAETLTCPNGLTATWWYDIMDRMTDLAWVDTNGLTVKSWHYDYDNGNRVTAVDRENGSSDEYAYDDLDRLTSESRADGAATWTYDLAGNRVGRTVNKGGLTLTITNTLDASDRLLGWSVLETNPACMIEVSGVSSEPIGLDNRFGQLWVSNTVAVTPSVSGSNFSATISLGMGTQQIVAAIRDAAGNVGYATSTVWATVVTNAQYGYDAAGSVTNILYSGTDYAEERSLAWDGAYRLTSVATNGAEAESYGYNAYGQRVWTASGGVTNWHVYDGPHVVTDLNVTGGVVRTYVYGPGIDNILAMTVHTGATPVTYFFLTDRLGSVSALTDGSGNVVEQYKFDAWGRVLAVQDGAGNPLARSSVGNRYLWQGREYSWGTGLYYFRARWYDPITGRWLSNDPIGISGGLNQYVFCANNPVNFRDPFGLCTEADTRMQQIRTFIDAERIAAANSWWASEGFVETLGAIALHGGPWSPLDLMANAPGQTWTVNGQTMTSPQFGNYLAGYYAGYAGSQGILAGMYAGGVIYAAGGNIVTLGHYGESWTDAQSVPFISVGFGAGSQARNHQPQPPR